MSGDSRVLLVGRDQERLSALKELVAPVTTHVFSAQSSDATLELCREHEFAVILMDLEETAEEGRQMAQRIRSEEYSRKAPIVFLTSPSAPGPNGDGQLGPVKSLPRRVPPETLRNIVQSYLSSEPAGTLEQQREEVIRATQTARNLLVTLIASERRRPSGALTKPQWDTLALLEGSAVQLDLLVGTLEQYAGTLQR